MICINDDFISLPSRENITNKGDAGNVLIVGGNLGMCGAAAFASEAALRSGCGLVRAYVHPENRIPMQTLVPEAVLCFWENELDTPVLDNCLEWADAVVVGVGFGTGDTPKKLLKKILKKCKKPLVIDADAINIISKSFALLSLVPENAVITPHLGELSRLTGVGIDEIKKDTFKTLEASFGNIKLNIVAKSDTTSILLSSGEKMICSSGTSALSTGGTGDVLAGMIASFMAQKMPCDKAVPAAVYLHGLAGRKAGEALGERSVIARDVINAIPSVLKKY